MHLTPEQIDRQPFRMTRRGYDIVQVRDFLREIASEMRERQRVRDRLIETGHDEAAAEAETHTIINNTRGATSNAEIATDGRNDSTDVIARSERRAEEIIAEAEAEAQQLLEQSEERARERSGVVIGEAQARLDQLLAQERELRSRLETQRASAGVAAVGVARTRPALGMAKAAVDPTTDSRDRTEVAGPDTSLADFMKATLRHEVRPD